jgi:hypothetical protein
MPKTKQTAKKSTGGAAKRKAIIPSARILRSKTSRSRQPSCSPQPTLDVEMAEEVIPEPVVVVPGSSQVASSIEIASPDNTDEVSGHCRLFTFLLTDCCLLCQWCHLCSDGGELLIICNKCGAATCKRCIPGLGALSGSGLDDCTFECVGCSKKGAIFYVSFKPISALLAILKRSRDCIVQMEHQCFQVEWPSVPITLPVP